MKHSLYIFTIFLFALDITIQAQEKAIINDPDGYTNIREEQNSKSRILGKVKEGQVFFFYANPSSDWWQVEFNASNSDEINGFIHKSRIIPIRDKLTTTYYHEFEPTASDFRLLRRNISKKDLPPYYIIEMVDSMNRVIELRFCHLGKILTNNLCYLSPWIKYDYPSPNIIVTRSLNSNGSKQSSFECDTWYKTTYTIDDSQTRIIDTKIEYSFDVQKLAKFMGWTEEKVKEEIQYRYDNQPKISTIEGYWKSYAKLNGKFPVREIFDIEAYNYIGLEYEEVKEIIKNYR
jgi:uncharacterized protein YgiM (DUF1202 family)